MLKLMAIANEQQLMLPLLLANTVPNYLRTENNLKSNSVELQPVESYQSTDFRNKF